MGRTIFVTATDTGVGKTTVSAALAKIAKEAGINVGYFKPVETGCEPECMDAKLLSQITGQSYEEVVLYRFKNPVAPLVAEREEKSKISINEINLQLKKLQKKYDFLIVEGAGGVFVPISKEGKNIYTYLDFAQDNNLEVLVVARASLGTINHTLLTVEALRNRGIKIKGIVLNEYPEEPSLSEKTNPFIIKEMAGINILAICRKRQNYIKECQEKLREFLNFSQYVD